MKTTGVVEHTFSLPKNSEFRGGVEWKIYDVGGARPQRQAWAPYFDDGGFPTIASIRITSGDTFTLVNAIIFLAPISSFDQVLAEVSGIIGLSFLPKLKVLTAQDPSINRLEDSFQLWQAVVSNPILQKVNIILFLNKCDLLKVVM